MDPKARQEGENSKAAGPARFGGLDQLDWLMIVISVLLGTVARRYHLLALPDRFLEWVLPFLLMVAGYRTRRKVTELSESRRAKAKRPAGK
jgi:uncharacterized membrane protein YfcA